MIRQSILGSNCDYRGHCFMRAEPGRRLTGLNSLLPGCSKSMKCLKGGLTSQYARFLARLGKRGASEQLFKEAEAISRELSGRKFKINLGLLAIDRAKVFQFDKAKEMVIDELTDSAIADPIYAEVLVIEQVIKNLLPREAVFL